MSNPIQEEIIIELRQQNNNTIKKFDDNGDEIAGDYKCHLDEPLYINEGDEVSIKNVFVDSVDTNSDKIIIGADESTITVESGIYMLDWGVANTNLTYSDQKVKEIGPQVPDGKPYYLTEPKLKDNTMEEIFAFSCFTADNPAQWNKEPNAYFSFVYENVHGKEGLLSFSVDKTLIKFNSNQTEFQIRQKDHPSVPMPFFIKKGSLKGTSDKNEITKMQNTGVAISFPYGIAGVPVQIDDSTTASADGGSAFPFYKFTSTFTIKQGSYTPSDLADTISKELSKITAGDTNYITNQYVDSNFLFTSNELKDRADIGNGTHVKFVRADVQNALSFDTGENFWVGSSEMGLVYNEDTSKFAWDRIHSSLYSNAGISVVKTIDNGTNKFVANKTGGVFFHDLKPRSLWQKKLGFSFDLTDDFCCVVGDGKSTTKTIGNLNNGVFYELDLKDGKTTTCDEVVLDSFIIKNNDSANNQTFDQPLASFANLESGGSISQQIVAKDAFQKTEDTANVPYYQIEVDLGVQNKKYGANNFNSKISSIISRFYDSDSYSSSMDSSGSFTYIHKGQPVNINEIGIRVLDPQGNLADTIGTDNSVFVSVIKPK